MRDPEDVFEGAPAHAFDALARAAPGHVGPLDFGVRGGGGCGEEVAPDGDLGAPPDGCETAVADGDGGPGAPEGVFVYFFEHADVPDGHFEILPG